MKLFLAEKPSLGRAIASAIGNKDKTTNEFIILNNGETVVSWCYGHILEQVEPQEYDEKYKYWSFENLPIFPNNWKLKVISSAAKQFGVVKKLISQADVIVNAGDPDREGQLLIDEVLDYVGNKKPVLRILLNALDEKSIKQALSNLQDNRNFLHFHDSALARSRADWLIGMNLTRAYSIGRDGKSDVIRVGRVMTPTMCLVVRRENEIKNFTPVKHFSLTSIFKKDDIEFPADWLIPENFPNMDSQGRILNFDAVNKIAAEMNNCPTIEATFLDINQTQKQEVPPLPYSLSALQIEAGRRYNFSPQKILDAMQQLYEWKFSTYPRSDCDYLPENQFVDAQQILKNLSELPVNNFSDFVQNTDTNIKSRAWNDKKISAHHAIIPTILKPDWSKFNDIQQKLYIMIAQRYIAQFYKNYSFLATQAKIQYADQIFIAKGKTVSDLGWRIIFKKTSDDEEQNLPKLFKGDSVNCLETKVIERTTKPPAHFTTATLLQAMKEIHKFVKDESLKEQLKDCSGIGTEATRAGIIEKLLKEDFLSEQNKNLQPTQKAVGAFKILPDELTYPDLTALWENELNSENFSIEKFMQSQFSFINKLIEPAKKAFVANIPSAVCPNCKNAMKRLKSKKTGNFFWKCDACNSFFNDADGKPFVSPTVPCPKCNNPMTKFKSKSGDYLWSCKNCNFYFQDKNNSPVVIKCPKCGKGFLSKRHGKKGDFWSCNTYPDCDFLCNDSNGNPTI